MFQQLMCQLRLTPSAADANPAFRDGGRRSFSKTIYSYLSGFPRTFFTIFLNSPGCTTEPEAIRTAHFSSASSISADTSASSSSTWSARTGFGFFFVDFDGANVTVMLRPSNLGLPSASPYAESSLTMRSINSSAMSLCAISRPRNTNVAFNLHPFCKKSIACFNLYA